MLCPGMFDPLGDESRVLRVARLVLESCFLLDAFKMHPSVDLVVSCCFAGRLPESPSCGRGEKA